MRRSTLAIIALLLPAAASAQLPGESRLISVAGDCPTESLVSTPAGPAELKRLDRLPPADHILTVLRTEGGCPTLVVVREGIGTTTDPN